MYNERKIKNFSDYLLKLWKEEDDPTIKEYYEKLALDIGTVIHLNNVKR